MRFPTPRLAQRFEVFDLRPDLDRVSRPSQPGGATSGKRGSGSASLTVTAISAERTRSAYTTSKRIVNER